MPGLGGSAHLDVDHPAVPAGVRAAPRQHQAQNPAAAPLQLRPPRRGRGGGSPRDALPRQHCHSADPTAAGDRGLRGDPAAWASAAVPAGNARLPASPTRRWRVTSRRLVR